VVGTRIPTITYAWTRKPGTAVKHAVERFIGQGAHGRHYENDSEKESDTTVFGDKEADFAMAKELLILNVNFCSSCRSLLLWMPSLRPIGGETFGTPLSPVSPVVFPTHILLSAHTI
jgi:hypothetical protein